MVDIGAAGTTVSVLHEGYTLNKCANHEYYLILTLLAALTSEIGGDFLTRLLVKLAALPQEPRPRYLFDRKKTKAGRWDVKPIVRTHATASYHAYSVFQIYEDFKTSICKVSPTPFNSFTRNRDRSIPLEGVEATQYELPDGSIVAITDAAFAVPEVLFQPSLLETWGEPAVSSRGVADMLRSVIEGADPELRRELSNGVVVTGATTLLPGFTERLQADATNGTPHKYKFIAPSNSSERRFSSWIGGSILASLGSFNQMWISLEEYNEVGSQIVHSKCP